MSLFSYSYGEPMASVSNAEYGFAHTTSGGDQGQREQYFQNRQVGCGTTLLELPQDLLRVLLQLRVPVHHLLVGAVELHAVGTAAVEIGVSFLRRLFW